MDLVDIVSAIFSYQGFTILAGERSAGDEASGVLARRGTLEIAIAIVPGSAPLDEVRLHEILEQLAERTGARHLVAYAGVAAAGVRGAAAEVGAVLWERERLLAEAGAAFVGTADPDPFGAPGGGSPSQASFDLASAGAARPRGGRGWPDASRPAPRTIVPARAPDGESMLGAVPLEFSEERAREAAGRMLKARALRTALEWVPSYLIDFHVEVEVRTPRGEESLLHSGTLLVSATGGEVEEIDRPIEVVAADSVLAAGELARASARRRLTPLQARERARSEALARAVRTVERVQERGTVTVMERQAWRPKGSQVDLVVRGVLLVPLYLVETEHGLASIDGASGKAMRLAPFAGERTG